MTKYKENINNFNNDFFKGLNELRAVAAFCVIFHHIELYKHSLSNSSLYDFSFVNYFIDHLGKNGVYLFFVLSGFLITYLLLVEKEKTNKINIFKFYGRRVLRIWPLYYLIVLISFVFLPYIFNFMPDFFEGQSFFNEKVENIVYRENLVLFIFFFSNVALRMFGPVVGASQSWSVSVEEQFYFIWPWIVKLFYKKLMYVLVLIIVLINLLNLKIAWFSDYPYLKYFIQTFTVDYMAFGGIMAIIFKNHKPQLRKLINNKYFIFLICILLPIHLFFSISSISLAIIFSFLIVILIERDKESKMFSILGKWSYGIYMYHPLIMYFSFSIVHHLNLESILLTNLLIYSLVFGGTIIISYLSFEFIENYFLKFKTQFSPKEVNK